jgi:hypothetical protein
MHPADRDAFFELCQNAEYGTEKHPYGIWLSNAFPTDGTNAGTVGASDIKRSSAIYAGYCRLNHSCSPNVHGAWNDMRGKQTMYAMRDIKQGEELVVSYLGSIGEQPREARRESLRTDFGFICTCAKCLLADDALSQSDARCERLLTLTGLIREAVSSSGFQREVAAAMAKRGVASVPSRADAQLITTLREKRKASGIALLEERLALLDADGQGGRSWDTLEALHRFCSEMGDEVLAQRYAARAAQSARMALGEDSVEYVKYAKLSGGDHTMKRDGRQAQQQHARRSAKPSSARQR